MISYVLFCSLICTFCRPFTYHSPLFFFIPFTFPPQSVAAFTNPLLSHCPSTRIYTHSKRFSVGDLAQVLTALHARIPSLTTQHGYFRIASFPLLSQLRHFNFFFYFNAPLRFMSQTSVPFLAFSPLCMQLTCLLHKRNLFRLFTLLRLTFTIVLMNRLVG